MTHVPDDLADRLATFLADTDCPGAQLGVLVDGEVQVHAAGVLNLDTGVDVTEDSVFQIGSTTKVWTATLVMQLVDEGALALDTRVHDVLPEFSLAAEETADQVTIEHLLTHTSGIEGDVFDDVGTNDDCLERYVEALASQGTVHELGETWSYCNSGWILLGRIVEVLTGLTWDQAIAQRIGQPLGLERLCTLPAEAILHRVAVGHVKPPGADGFVVARQWALPRALGPSGLITTSVADLLRFGRMHLEEGRAPDGTQVLSPRSVKAMRQAHASCPERYLLADAWGLGWMIDTRGRHQLIGHGGNTIGQSAYLHLVPERDVGVALLTNLGGGTVQARRLLSGVLSELADVTLPALPEPAEDPADLDLDRLTGTYRRHSVETVVTRTDEGLHATVTMAGPMVAALGGDPTIEMDLRPGEQGGDDRALFVGRNRRLGGDGWVPVTFYGTAQDGRARFLHTGARAAVRVDA